MKKYRIEIKKSQRGKPIVLETVELERTNKTVNDILVEDALPLCKKYNLECYASLYEYDNECSLWLWRGRI